MTISKLIGLLLLVSSPIIVVIYALGLMYAAISVLQLTAFTGVFLVFTILTWIGYTMSTNPPSPEARDSTELDDLNAETVLPRIENHIVRAPRLSTIVDTEIGEGTVIMDYVNLQGCKVGKNCRIESFAYVEEDVTIGDRCRINPHVYIPTGVLVEDDVVLGANVTLVKVECTCTEADFDNRQTIVSRGALIGANSTILPGVRIGRNARIGAGSVVTSDVPDNATVSGNPAKLVAAH